MSEALDPGARQRLAYERGASVWVSASAGTGKTKVLTDRVLSLLLHKSPPSKILCLTFTKAAAAEMANRINERLSQWTILGDGALDQDIAALTGAVPDADQRDYARQLFALVLDAPGGMTIVTIHAFCQSLLRRFPLEAGVPPHFDLMDERSSAEALEAARETVLTQAREDVDRDLAEALAEVVRHVQEASFADLLAALSLERARLAAALAPGFARFTAALRRVLGLKEGETVESIVTTACAGADEAALRRAADAMLASPSVNDKRRGEIIAAWLADPMARAAGFDAYLRGYFTATGDRFQHIVTKKLADANPDIADAVAAEAERLQAIRERRSAAELYAASSALARLASALLDEYARVKAARALLDYDDLVLKTRDLLLRPGVAPWVLFKLDGGLDHILIDEAQDTNPEQWEIVRLIAEEFFAGESAYEDRHEDRRTIFAVGDAKQSIYSFQRADPQKFVEMRAHFAQAVESANAKWRVVPLEISFRSVAAVLQAVDAVFAQSFARDGVALDGLDIRHEAFRRGHAGLIELWPPVEAETQPIRESWPLPLKQQGASEPRARLARAIAGTIRSWLDRGEKLAARGHVIRAGDVLVLVRRRGPFVTELVRALKAAEVAVAGVDRMFLTDQLAVEDMMALGQFLLLPDDDLTLATVLKGPFYNFSEDALFALAYQRRGTLWDGLRRRRDERPEFAYAADQLMGLSARVDFVPPYELFAEVLGARRGRKAMFDRLGPEAGDPLDEFLAAALAYERAHGVSLQGFLHWLAAGTTEIKRDLDQSGRDEVRIMTVHGAKGLEAPIVFLPDTLQVPTMTPSVLWSDGGLPLWLIDRSAMPRAAATALEDAKRRRDQEYRRLLYVAMTRAADRLYVCGWQTQKKPPAGNWHEMVATGLAAANAESFEFDAEPWLGDEGWTGPGLRLVTPQLVVPQVERVAADFRAGAAILPEWCWREPPPEPAPPRPLAPSQPREEEPATRSPLGEDRGTAFLRGRLVHRLLQSLPNLAPGAREKAARQFLARKVHGLTRNAQAALLRETLSVLEHPDFAPLFAPGSAAEVPVVGLVGGRALSGQIDRLVVSGDSVLIVDYKTMRPVPSAAAGIPRAYLDQLAAYRAAVAAVYPGKTIRCALLWTDGPTLMPVADEHLATYL